MAWYNSLWRYRKKLTIPAANVAGTGAISGAVLKFAAASDANIKANSRADGWDILFTTSDGTTKIPHELVCDRQYPNRNGAWTWFATPMATYNSTADKTWIGTVGGNASGTQDVTEYNHATGALTTTNIATALTVDDHSNPIVHRRSSDGKLLCYYCDEHPGNLRYKLSTNANDSTAWGSAVNIDVENDATYPNPRELTTSGEIFLIYRKDAGDWGYRISTDNGATYSAFQSLFTPGTNGWGARPYVRSCTNGTNRIDFIVSQGTPDHNTGDEHEIYHFYYLSGAWYNSVGTSIGTPTFTAAELTKVHDGGATDSTWVGDIRYKANGQPHALWMVYPTDDERNHDLWYGSFNGTTWDTEKVTDEGTGINSGVAYNYGGSSVLDPLDENIIWMSKEVSGVYEIQKWTQETGTWAKEYDVTTGSTLNHFRLQVVENCPVTKVGRVMWFSPTLYTTYLNYTGAIQCFPALDRNFTRAYVKADIHGTNDTDIYVYWGNPNAADQQNRTSTWSGYEAVYHTTERFGASPARFHDTTGVYSSINWHNASAGETVDTADIGASHAFNGTSEKWTPGTIPFASQTGGSLECYVKYASTGTDEHSVMGTGDLSGTTAQLHVRLEPTDDTVEPCATIDTNSFKGGTSAGITVTPNTWQYLFAGWGAAAGLRARVNKTEGSIASSTGTAFDATASPAFYVGGRSTAADWFSGNIAEIRVCNDRYLSKDQTDTQVDNWTNGNAFFTIAALESVDLVNLTGISAFNIFTALLTSASNIGALTETATAADYDWSGMGLKADRSGSLSVGALAACTLITDRHGISAWHAGPNVNDVVYFRSPDGTERQATVQAITRMGTSDIRLVRFTSAPHASLARYPIITNGEELIGEGFWTPQHTSVIAYREITSFGSDRMNHQDGGWGIGETSSGRPSMVPLDSGSFGILGTAWHTSDHAWLEPQINNINSALSAYSETVGELDATGLATPDPAIISGTRTLVDDPCVNIAAVNLEIINLTCIS